MTKTPVGIYRLKRTGVLYAWRNPKQDPKVWDYTDLTANLVTPDPVPTSELIVPDQFPTVQLALNNAKEGDTVFVKNGSYIDSLSSNDDAYHGTVNITRNNITLKAYPGHAPIIDARDMQTWGIAVGSPRADVYPVISNVVIDGFEVINAQRNGIKLFNPKNVTVRNCKIHDNNTGWSKHQAVSYEYGVMIMGGEDVTIEGCRIFNNGGGINFYELDALNGCKRPIVRQNFVYANANSGNMGNSSGIACRFTEHAEVYDNVFYDGADANINGLGAIHSKFLRNVLLNAWQPGGNNEGIKFAVRGGGNNLVASSLFAFNGNTGYDATDGIGDQFINNTVYGNESWGILCEGSNTQFFNNISVKNTNIRNGGEFCKDFRPPNDGGAEAIAVESSWNLFTDSEHDIQYFLNRPMPNTYYARDPEFIMEWPAPPRNNSAQVIHPEEYFHLPSPATVSDVQILLSNCFRPQIAFAGLDLKSVHDLISNASATLRAKLNLRIEAWKDSPASEFQRLQAVEMWRRILRDLDSGAVVYGVLPEVRDLKGTLLSDNVKIGCAQ